MATKNVMGDVFDLVLSAPGMNSMVKVSLNVSARNLLLLNFIIEEGLNTDAGEDGLLGNFPGESKADLQAIADELLAKGELHEMKEKLKRFKA